MLTSYVTSHPPSPLKLTGPWYPIIAQFNAMSSDEIRPVSEGPASNEAQTSAPTPAPAPGPTAAPTPAPPTSKERQTPIAGYRNPIHNPFPASLASAFTSGVPVQLTERESLTLNIGECRKAGQIIDSFVNPKYAGLEGAIPARILGPAKVRPRKTTQHDSSQTTN
jgi:hypothetical protein